MGKKPTRWRGWIFPLLLSFFLLLSLGGCIDEAADSCLNFNNANDASQDTSCDETSSTDSGKIVLASVATINEVVVIVNQGTIAEVLTSWTLENEGSTLAEDTFTFPSFSLAAGHFVRIHSKIGDDDANDLYWDGGGHWDSGDTALLSDESGISIDACGDGDSCWDGGN